MSVVEGRPDRPLLSQQTEVYSLDILQTQCPCPCPCPCPAPCWQSCVAGYSSRRPPCRPCRWWEAQLVLLTRPGPGEVTSPAVTSPPRGPARPPPGALPPSRRPQPQPRPRHIKIVWLPVTASIRDSTTSCQWTAPGGPPRPPTPRGRGGTEEGRGGASLPPPSPHTTTSAETNLRPRTVRPVCPLCPWYSRQTRRLSELTTSQLQSRGRKRICKLTPSSLSLSLSLSSRIEHNLVYKKVWNIPSLARQSKCLSDIQPRIFDFDPAVRTLLLERRQTGENKQVSSLCSPQLFRYLFGFFIRFHLCFSENTQKYLPRRRTTTVIQVTCFSDKTY